MTKFINLGGPVKIRIGKPRLCYWKTLKNNEVIDLPLEQGKSLGLSELKTTEGKLGPLKVETKQIETDRPTDKFLDNYTPDDLFFKELIKIKGVGSKTAKDIVVWGTKEKLIEVIEVGGSLPFRDDIEILLKKQFLKKGESL